MLGGVAALVVVVAISIIFWPFGNDESPTPTATSAPVLDSEQPAVPTVTSDTTAVATAPIEPTATPAQIADCRDLCLVRLAVASSADAESLRARGLQSAYERDGWIWAAGSTTLVNELAADGIDLTVIERDAETLPLYIVRYGTGQRGTAESLIADFGEIVDQADNQLLVRVPDLVPDISGLIDAGIAIEKLPPPQGSAIDAKKPALAGPGIVADGSSIDELTRTVEELQAIGADDGESIGSRANRTTGNALAADYIARRMIDIGLTVRYQDFVAWDGTYAVNVIGELAGSDTSKTYLVLGHYDTINLQGGLAPGADDNATGIAAMLEIARILSQYDLPYSIQFLATSAEEEAMGGAIEFANAARASGQTFAGAFNMDSLGWIGRDHQLVVNGDASTTDLQNLLVAINDAFGLGQDIVIRQNPKIIADDNPLRDAGIPAVYIARALYGENPVHHSGDDTIEKVDFPNVKTATDLILLTLAELQTR